MAYPLRVADLRRTGRYAPGLQDSMTEIAYGEPDRTCDLRQRILVRIASADVCAVAEYRSLIAELSGFARVRCPSDADRCWSSGPEMRDNGLEAMCSMPVSRVLP
jgi:hypothetical protein